jgi:hypothetical protein
VKPTTRTLTRWQARARACPPVDAFRARRIVSSAIERTSSVWAPGLSTAGSPPLGGAGLAHRRGYPTPRGQLR